MTTKVIHIFLIFGFIMLLGCSRGDDFENIDFELNDSTNTGGCAMCKTKYE